MKKVKRKLLHQRNIKLNGFLREDNLFDLEAELLDTKNYNVYSLGSWGWGTDQQLIILKKTIKVLKPDLVILFFTMNDLTNNYHNIGFIGEKPTYKLEGDRLIEPNILNLKKYLNYSWIYRASYRIFLKYKNRHLKSFLEDDNFKTQKKCEKKPYLKIKDLIEAKRDYNFLKEKILESSKIFSHISSKEDDIKKNYYRFYGKRNNYEKDTDIKFDYFRNYRTDLEENKIKLTRRLLNELQSISKKYNSEFILLIHHNYNYLFKENIDYKVCINYKEIIYSNKNYFKTIDDTFKGIETIIEHKVPRGEKWYDPIDGHLNYKNNKIIFKKVSDKILSFRKNN